MQQGVKNQLLISFSGCNQTQTTFDQTQKHQGCTGRPALSPLTSTSSRGSDFNTCGLSCPQCGWCLGGHCTWASSLPLTHSHTLSLHSILPQKSWKKRAPRWPRQAVRFCKLTALIMSFCYSDTRSARPPHWTRSRPGGEAGAWGGGRIRDSGTPPALPNAGTQ